MADLVSKTLEPATNGLNTDDSPGRMAMGYAPRHENLLVDRGGVLPMRGPITNHAELVIGTNDIPAGAWAFNDKLLVGRVAKNATAVREPWTAPYRKASAANQLALPLTTMKYVDFDAMTVSDVAGGHSNVIGGRGVRIGDFVYGYSYGVDTATNPAVNENGGFLHRRRLLRWDGTASVPTVYTNAPEGAQDVASHLNRLWVLGGRDVPGGGSLIEANTLYFSDQGGPITDTAARWQDDVTGLVNKLVIDSDDANDFGATLAKVGQNLVIFKRRSIHVLYGYSATTFTLRPFTRELGCVDPRTIVEYEGVVYFLSQQGYMAFDGSGLIDLNNGLRSSLVAAAHNTVGEGGVDGGRAVATKLPNNYVLLSICKQDTVTGAQSSSDRFSGLLHTPSGRWTSFSSNALTNPVPVALGRTSTKSYLIDANKVVKCDRLTIPETVPEAERGLDVTATPTRTNYAMNPSAEVDTAIVGTSGTNYSGVVLTRESCSWNPDSDFCFRVTGTHSTTTPNPLVIRSATSPSNQAPAAPGQVWSASARVRTIDPSVTTSDIRGYRLFITYRDVGGALLENHSGDFTADEGAVDLLLEFTAPTTPASTALVEFQVALYSDTDADLVTYEATQLLLEKAALPGSYFDGDSPHASWTGAPHASFSTFGTVARIPSALWTRILDLSSPEHHSQLHRLLIDYVFVVDGGADGGTNGWFVTAVRGDGSPLVEAEYQLPSMGDPGAFAYRRRHVQDTFREADDIQVRIEWRDAGGTYPALVRAEIHDITVEYQKARQRRST